MERLKFLARSYGGDHEEFFSDLRKRDLEELLTDPTELDDESYYLPSAGSYSKAELVRIALECFRDDAVAGELVSLGPVGEDEDEDEDAAPGAMPDDVFVFDPVAAASLPHGYQKELTAALETAVARARAGKRLRITVATGGGKTRIANDWVWNHALPKKHRVLWVTKDWALLRQAASDLCRRQRGSVKRLGYVGAKGNQRLGALGADVNASVVYATIHTWRRRKDTTFADTDFHAVIIDESHWGEGKTAYRDLQKRYRETAVFIGLTATPREGTSFTLVGREYDYLTLQRMGILARPIREREVRTNFSWSAERSTAHGDFDRASLSKVARSDRRNTLIVATYLEGRIKFGKTLIFACDIEHAAELNALLQRKGVASQSLHSGMTSDQQHTVIQDFTSGKTRVLVNVAMMTHGIDIPDIETVFLARPTLSKILFAQMVGRAVRKTETKTHFRLVDFVDSMKAHGELLVSSTSYFGDLGGGAVTTGKYQRSPRRSEHAFTRATFEHLPNVAGYEEIAGLDIQPEQTFGIEFEVTRDDFAGEPPRDWQKVANELLAAIPAPKAPKANREYHDNKDHSVWNVEYDRSCGWEVTSRILSGPSAFLEIMDVCRALESEVDRLGLKLTPKTGTHVHLGWEPNVVVLRRLMQLVSYFEPALYTLVAPSRSGNPYCKPIRRNLASLLELRSLRAWAQHFEDRDKRYLTVNPSNLFGEGLGTIEVRMHSGTIEGPKILGWLSLWMRMLDSAQRTTLPGDSKLLWRDLPLTEGPEGDVSQLAEFVLAHRELAEYLRERRAVVMEQWFKHPTHGAKARAVAATWA